MDVNSF